MKDRKALEWLLSQLPDLVESGVLTKETAEAIRVHYHKNGGLERPQNRAVILCAILGGTLIGAGIILLIAHNWDEMGRSMRTVISFLPLAAASLLAGWAILRKPASSALHEGSGIFHVLSIGAAISLISQTYNISGNFSDFILTWSLLGLPLVYLLRSTSVALLYLLGITVWAGSRSGDSSGMLWYWPLFAAVMPFYGSLLQEGRFSIRANWLSAGIGVSVPVALGVQCNDILEKTWFLLFSGYFTMLYLVECQWFRRDVAVRFDHPFRVIGGGGIMILSIAMSYGGLWGGYNQHASGITASAYVIAFCFSYGFVVAAVLLLIFSHLRKTEFNLFAAAFPLAALVAFFFYLHGENTAIIIVMNCYAAVLALGTIFRGFKYNHLGTLNAGMVIAAAVIIARFFDSDLSFVVRGVAFILIGIGFLVANWMLLKKEKKNAV